MYLHPELRKPLAVIGVLVTAWLLEVFGIPALTGIVYVTVVGSALLVAVGTAILTVYVFGGLLWSLVKAFGSSSSY